MKYLIAKFKCGIATFFLKYDHHDKHRQRHLATIRIQFEYLIADHPLHWRA
jgi:hypothetical protein